MQYKACCKLCYDKGIKSCIGAYNPETTGKIVNQNYSDKYDKVAANQEAKYRLGLEDRPGRSCFITTTVCDRFGKADDCYELTAFRNFRDKWLALQAYGKKFNCRVL